MKTDYAGRSFLWGARDCLALVREIYADNFDIAISNIARPTNWSSETIDLIRLVHEREGFEMITDWRAQDLRPGDILCMSIGERCANHLAVYLGDNLIAHHLYGRFSSVEPYRDFFRSATCFLLRHPAVPDLRPLEQTHDLRSLVRDRYAVKT